VFGEEIKQNALFGFTPPSNRRQRKLTTSIVLQSPVRPSASHTKLKEGGGGGEKRGGKGGGGEENVPF